jgi:hypothetical protein
MSPQLSLFDKPLLPPTDSHVHPADERRLTGQNAAILRRLRQGKASSLTLAGISLKYTSRISDLRKHGFKIVCERTHSGTNLYSLEQ